VEDGGARTEQGRRRRLILHSRMVGRALSKGNGAVRARHGKCRGVSSTGVYRKREALGGAGARDGGVGTPERQLGAFLAGGIKAVEDDTHARG
jgi:hypothetical protein